MNKLGIYCLFLVLVTMSGCQSRQILKDIEKTSLPSIQKEIKDESFKVENNAKSISVRSNNITKYADSILLKSNDKEITNIASDVRQESQKIQEESMSIISSVLSLGVINNKLDEEAQKYNNLRSTYNDSLSQNKKLSNEINKLNTKISDLNSKGKALTNKLLSYLIVSCIIGIGASVAISLFVNVKIGIMVAISSLFTAVSAVVFQEHADKIAYFGLVIVFVVISYVLYKIYVYRNNIMEIVATTEAIKDDIPEDKRKKYFGDETDKGQISREIQSLSTRQMVAETRKKITKKSRWNILLGK